MVVFDFYLVRQLFGELFLADCFHFIIVVKIYEINVKTSDAYLDFCIVDFPNLECFLVALLFAQNAHRLVIIFNPFVTLHALVHHTSALEQCTGFGELKTDAIFRIFFFRQIFAFSFKRDARPFSTPITDLYSIAQIYSEYSEKQSGCSPFYLAEICQHNIVNLPIFVRNSRQQNIITNPSYALAGKPTPLIC